MVTELPHTADDINPATLCIYCMQRKAMLAPCPNCGHKEIPSKQHPLYLKPRTVLKQQYIVGKALGQGGFGITYIGFDKWLHKKVAIKEYLPAALATRDFREASVMPLKRQEIAFTQGLGLFIEEARNLAKFDHPHIVRVLNFFEENQTGYMVMEYLEGDSLGDYLSQHGGKLSLSQTLTIINPILDALAVVHAEHLYHRDISAQNIRLLTNGTPILIDFGAARHVIGEHSHTLDLVLKHGYSPIEQYSGRGKIGAWTDIYACGALLYLMLTGVLPSAATDRLSEDQLLSLCAQPSHVEAAILKALALKLEQRFHNIPSFKAALYDELTAPIVPVPVKKTSNKVVYAMLIVLITVLCSMVFVHISKMQQIDQLTLQIYQQLLAKQLFTPKESNAYLSYQQLLQRDPQNAVATQGLQQLPQYFVTHAKTAQQQAHFHEALATVEQGLQLMPQSAALHSLQNSLTAQIQQVARTQEVNTWLKTAQKLTAQGQLEEAGQAYRTLLELAPDENEVQQGLSRYAMAWGQKLRNSREQLSQRIKQLTQLLTIFPQQPEFLVLKSEFNTPKPPNIDELLRKAEQYFASFRLSEPKGENAYELYQQVLSLDPDQLQAQQGLRKIVESYEQLAQRETSPQKALIWIQKGLKIQPTHAGLLNLQKSLLAPTPAVVTEKNKPVQNNAPENPVTLPEAHDRITELLRTAQQQLNREQWEAAGQSYQSMLKLSSENIQAQQGLQQIVTHYEQQARKLQQQAHWAESLALISKGLVFIPRHAGLLGLQRDAMQQLNEPNTITTPPPNLLLTPSF